MSSPTVLEPHLDVPCADMSKTPSVPARIVRQVRLAELPGSTLPWNWSPFWIRESSPRGFCAWCHGSPFRCLSAADNSPTCTNDMARAALLASSSLAGTASSGCETNTNRRDGRMSRTPPCDRSELWSLRAAPRFRPSQLPHPDPCRRNSCPPLWAPRCALRPGTPLARWHSFGSDW